MAISPHSRIKDRFFFQKVSTQTWIATLITIRVYIQFVLHIKKKLRLKVPCISGFFGNKKIKPQKPQLKQILKKIKQNFKKKNHLRNRQLQSSWVGAKLSENSIFREELKKVPPIQKQNLIV